MIRWFLAALGAIVVLGAFAPGTQLTHGRGPGRRQRPIRRGERVVAAVLGALWIVLVLRLGRR